MVLTLVTGITVALVGLLSTGVVAHRSLQEFRAGYEDALGGGPVGPLFAGEDLSSSTELAAGLRAAGMECLVETPGIYGCYALQQTRWASVRWLVSPDGAAVAELAVDLADAGNVFSSSDAVLTALAQGLGLDELEAVEVREALTSAATAQEGEEFAAETTWGDVWFTSLGQGAVQGGGYGWSPAPLVYAPSTLGPLHRAVAVLERQGYTCHQTETQTETETEVVECEDEDYSSLVLHGWDGSVHGLDVVRYRATEDDVRALLAAAPGAGDGEAISALLGRLTLEPTAQAQGGWSVLHVDDWVRVSAVGW